MIDGGKRRRFRLFLPLQRVRPEQPPEQTGTQVPLALFPGLSEKETLQNRHQAAAQHRPDEHELDGPQGLRPLHG